LRQLDIGIFDLATQFSAFSQQSNKLAAIQNFEVVIAVTAVIVKGGLTS